MNWRDLDSNIKLVTGAFEFSSSPYLITTVLVEMDL